MRLTCLAYFTATLLLGLASCPAQQRDAGWPDPRPLGREFKTYAPPARPPVSTASQEVKEPTGVITLRDALALALMQSPELAAFSWEVRAGEARTLQAKLPPNPELGVSVENFGNTALEGTDGVTTTVQLSQLVLLGGKLRKRTRVAALERDLAGWDYEAKRLDVLTDVTKAFVEVVASQERLAVTEELVRLAEQVHAMTGERVKAGKVSPVEETKAKVTLSTTRIERERAQRALDGARKRLATTWGGSAPTFSRAEGRIFEIAPIPSARELADAISQNPDIARWATEMEQRRATVKLEDAKAVPDVTVNAGVRQFNQADDTAAILGVSIPLPVFDRNQGGRQEARDKLAKAEHERKAATLRVLTTLAEAYQALSSAFVEATSLKNEVLPGAQSAFEAENEGFRLGKFGYLDVLDAQRTFFEARSKYIESLASYHKAVADVERLIGDRLESVIGKPEPK